MSSHTNETVVRRFWDSLNAGDIDAATQLWSPDAENHGIRVGRDGIRAVFTDLRDSLDERYQIHDLIAADGTVVCRLTAGGIHRGAPRLPVIHGGMLRHRPPSGRRYSIQQIHVLHCRGGSIVAHWANRDDLGMMQQLDIIPAA